MTKNYKLKFGVKLLVANQVFKSCFQNYVLLSLVYLIPVFTLYKNTEKKIKKSKKFLSSYLELKFLMMSSHRCLRSCLNYKIKKMTDCKMSDVFITHMSSCVHTVLLLIFTLYAMYVICIQVLQNLLFFIIYRNLVEEVLIHIYAFHFVPLTQWLLEFQRCILKQVYQLIYVYTQYWFSPMLFIATLDPNINYYNNDVHYWLPVNKSSTSTMVNQNKNFKINMKIIKYLHNIKYMQTVTYRQVAFSLLQIFQHVLSFWNSFQLTYTPCFVTNERICRNVLDIQKHRIQLKTHVRMLSKLKSISSFEPLIVPCMVFVLFQCFVSFSISPVVIIYASAENPYIIVVVFKIIITISPSCYIFHCEKFLYVNKVLVPKITHILIELNPTWIGILVLHGVVIIRARSSLVIHLVKVWVSRRVIILYCNEIVLFILFLY